MSKLISTDLLNLDRRKDKEEKQGPSSSGVELFAIQSSYENDSDYEYDSSVGRYVRKRRAGILQSAEKTAMTFQKTSENNNREIQLSDVEKARRVTKNGAKSKVGI